MKFPRLLFVLACASGLIASPDASAGMFSLNADTADNVVDNNGPGGTNEVGTNLTDYGARVGEYFAPGASSYVMPYQLPTLGAGESFTAASLQLQLFQLNNEGGSLGNADLYGLGVRATSTVLASDFYAGSNDAGNTLLQANFLTPASTVRTDANTGPFITTDAGGNAALVNFLNAVDPGGANAGQYVFLRISYDLNPTPAGNSSYTLLTQDAGGPNEKPLLTLTSAVVVPAPEPSTMVISVLSGIALVAIRRRRE